MEAANLSNLVKKFIILLMDLDLVSSMNLRKCASSTSAAVKFLKKVEFSLYVQDFLRPMISILLENHHKLLLRSLTIHSILRGKLLHVKWPDCLIWRGYIANTFWKFALATISEAGNGFF